MIQLIGVFLLILGIFVLVRGLRGRLLNTHPHCRGCGFDLHGLSFDTTSRCPECGRIVSSSKVAIRIGKRQRRTGMAVLGVFVLLLGIGGVGWQPISRISGLQNIDWYGHFPEPLLLSLESRGNTDALAELHSRLIPGELSDEGLQTLIDRSMAMLDDESVPWDERWGDVLLYALLTERMSDEAAKAYFERALTARLEINDEIGQEATTLKYWLSKYTPDRGRGTHQFRLELGKMLGDSGYFGIPRSPYGYSAESRIPRFAASGRGRPDRFGGWLRGPDGGPSSSGGWVPYMGGSMGSGMELRLNPDLGLYQLPFAARFEVTKNGSLFHQWEVDLTRVVKRVDNYVYASGVETHEMPTIASALVCPDILVPAAPKLSGLHESIRDSSANALTISGVTDVNAGLMGHIWLDNGEKQIEFSTISMPNIKANHGTVLQINQSRRQRSRSWLDEYIDQWAFWETVLENGEVDVIYRPDASRGAEDPRIERVVDHPIIWRGVPVTQLVPQQVQVNHPDGTSREQWTLERQSPIRPVPGVNSGSGRPGTNGTEPVHGEPYQEPGVADAP